MNKLGKFFTYLFNGVLFRLVCKYFADAKYIRKNKKWDGFDENDFVVKKICSKNRIRLYKDSQLAKFIFLDTFEPDEQKFISRFLSSGNTFLDVGSNIGLFSLIAAAKVKREGKVYAFEPTSKTFSRLQENIKINNADNIIAENLAVSDVSGNAEIYVSEDGFDAWNSIGKPSGGKKFTRESIKTITLDEYIKSNIQQKIDLIKIDVEGWEVHVINGAKEYLQENSPVLIIEFTDENAINAGSSCKILYEQIESMGYKIGLYSSKQNKVFIDPLRETYPYLNLIASKDIDQVNRISS